ncbi:MAG: tetratricopeptide repeat protein [Pyrinomonadaceae bacterium]|nr:tetratricopeptide repeat protein [Pyrinomonadaceae bacterium]
MFDKNLDEMTEADAEKLLLRIAPRINEHAAAVAEQCGRLPIALCAASSALKAKRSLSPEDYLKRLRDKKERLKLHDEVRNLTVEACFSLSYELLNEELQRRWRKLAIFPTDFDAPAAAAVWQTDVEAAKDALAELEEYSLLEWEETARRYSLHDLAHDFADTRLSATEREQTGLLHAAHYLQILSTADDLYLKGNEAIAGGLSLFDNERVNIEAGQEWAATRFTGDEQAARLCNRYAGYGVYVLNLRQHPRDFIRWQEAALYAARKLRDRRGEGTRLGNLGNAHRSLGEVRTAIEYHQQALNIAREIGDRRGEGIGLGNLGIAHRSLGETEKAMKFTEAALKIFEETESPNANTARSWLEDLRGKS